MSTVDEDPSGQGESDEVEPLGIGDIETLQDFTESDLMFISTTLWTLPSVIVEDVPEPEESDLQNFNRQFYLYCVRKGINPYDYFFDEFPLAIAAISMGAKMYKGYVINSKKRKNQEQLGDPATKEDNPRH